ncbi:hypothetical protein Tco_0677656 [Tanacetum coccineum]|uniref:Secreted protein n=1 Tax=Tanacetum coccineum TaxID=301880 RepID=A0ABQ4XCT3_9ASTR
MGSVVCASSTILVLVFEAVLRITVFSDADQMVGVIVLAISLPFKELEVCEQVAKSVTGFCILASSAQSSLTSFWYCFRMSKSLWYETSSNLCCCFTIVTNLDHSG